MGRVSQAFIGRAVGRTDGKAGSRAGKVKEVGRRWAALGTGGGSLCIGWQTLEIWEGEAW